MSNNDTSQDKHYREIKPASLDLSTPATLAEQSHAEVGREEAKPRRGLWLVAVAALIGVLAFVVFGLPQLVSEPDIPLATRNDAEPTASSAAETVRGPQSSPFQEALDVRERRQAQDILEPFLDLKLQLQEQGVEQWAAEEFDAAIASATAGDELYREGQYDAAIEQYAAGLKGLEDVQASKQSILEEALQLANNALEAGQAEDAQSYFNQALAIDVQNAIALQGLQRVEVLDETLAHMSAGQEFEAAGDYEQALASYKSANDLDSAHAAAGVGIKRVQALQSKAAFTGQMSAGYQALSDGRQTAAIAAFNKAQALRPDSSEAREALAQARGEQTVSAISAQFRQARTLEDQERWAEAADKYAAILKTDSNLQDAQQKRNTAIQRQKLYEALEKLNAEPLQLSRDKTYVSAEKVYAAAEKVTSPGPNLRAHMLQLKSHMQSSRNEYPVELTSDGYTTVMVQRVAKIGALSRHSLNLRPGEYVAVGSRAGYRDVRKTFTVLPGKPLSVDVRCVESI